MGANLYKSYKSSDAKLLESGYNKGFINLVDDFTTLSEPDDAPAAVGDDAIIADPHAWAVGKEPMALYVNPKILEGNGDSTGDEGSQRMKYTAKAFLKGDGPVAQSLIQSLMNKPVIFFHVDQCQNGEKIQYGCDCTPAEISKVTFTSGTFNGGSKGWAIEITSYCRFFYRGGDLVART